LGKGDAFETCLVTGDLIDTALKSEGGGQTFYVCGAGCIEVMKNKSTAYLKKSPAK
jgi:YHS domain-containing protein